jgi:hypothetical protein
MIMTNYENQKTEIDEILERNLWFGVEEETKKVAPCPQMSCFECLFHDERDSCHCGLRSMKWLVAEYKEPEIDWSKVPIDTPVLISGDGKEWYRRYFSGVDENGSPTVFCCGTTRWSSKNYDENENTWNVNHIKLAEVE